jgi:hypothetical protein
MMSLCGVAMSSLLAALDEATAVTATTSSGRGRGRGRGDRTTTRRTTSTSTRTSTDNASSTTTASSTRGRGGSKRGGGSSKKKASSTASTSSTSSTSSSGREREGEFPRQWGRSSDPLGNVTLRNDVREQFPTAAPVPIYGGTLDRAAVMASLGLTPPPSDVGSSSSTTTPSLLPTPPIENGDATDGRVLLRIKRKRDEAPVNTLCKYPSFGLVMLMIASYIACDL